MITIEQKWTNFRKMAYPTLVVNTAQYNDMKAVWFASYFDCMVTLHDIASTLSDKDQSTQVIAFTDEAQAFLTGFIERLRALEKFQTTQSRGEMN